MISEVAIKQKDFLCDFKSIVARLNIVYELGFLDGTTMNDEESEQYAVCDIFKDAIRDIEVIGDTLYGDETPSPA